MHSNLQEDKGTADLSKLKFGDYDMTRNFKFTYKVQHVKKATKSHIKALPDIHLVT